LVDHRCERGYWFHFRVRKAVILMINSVPVVNSSKESIAVQLAWVTLDDWRAISAAAGRTVGPDSDGTLLDGLSADGVSFPPIAFIIGMDREQGLLPAGHPVTAAYFRSFLAPGQAAEWDQEMAAAITYVARRDGVADVARRDGVADVARRDSRLVQASA
jgi:hypothetical protein